MKQRFYLFRRRNGIYFLQDAQTARQESLHTKLKADAEQLLQIKRLSVSQPHLNITMARTLLAAADPKLLTRTWTDVMDEFIARSGRPSTKSRRERAIRSRPFDLIRQKKLIETTGDDLREVIKAGAVFTNHFLRCLHNLAQGLGWLPWPIVPAKLWPTAPSKPKRGITLEEHQRIIAQEQNPERRLYYEFLWETGASQSDAAALTAHDIDWETRTLLYRRLKTGETCCLTIGSRLETLLRTLPAEGPLFPKIAQIPDCWRSAEFRRRCRLLGIESVSLHSYRYAWAERARCCGYPERFAQEALGHNSKAVHRAYARKARVEIPSLEEYERRSAEEKLVRVNFGQKTSVGEPPQPNNDPCSSSC